MIFFSLPLTDENEFSRRKKNQVIEQFILKTAGEDIAAFEKLYQMTRASVYAYALSLVKNAFDAEDVAHDCFVTVYSASSSYQPLGKPMAWLMTITRHLALKKLNEGKRKITYDQTGELKDKRDEISRSDERLLIQNCFSALKDEERHIIILHAVANMKHREIAAHLNLPLSTVLSKYNRGLKKLRLKIETEMKEE